MSLYEQIESAYMQALKQGNVPSRLHLTESGLQELINDRSLGASWIPSISDFWDQKVLGLPLIKSTGSIALEVNEHLVPISP